LPNLEADRLIWQRNFGEAFMSIMQILMTADELLAMPRDGFRYELVRGELNRTSPTGGEQGAIAMFVSIAMGSFVIEKGLGLVFGAETGFKIAFDPDTVRAPDFAYVRRERIPESGIPKGFWIGAPDLAVEVISPGDIYGEVEEKVLEWLDAGTKMVIVVNPRRRTSTVYRSRNEVKILSEGDELSGEDVLPGFSCKVSSFFA
jgi:Uma2 family endonuclease